MVRLAARSEGAIAAAEFPGQAVRDAPEQHLGEGHLRAQHEQQAHRVRHVGQEDAAEPARHLPGRGDGGHPPERRLDLEPGLLGAHLQGRVGQRASTTGRSSRSAAASSTISGRTRATRTARRTPTSAPTSSAAATATAGSTSRRATRCSARSATSRTAGAARTTSRSAARSSTSGSTTSAGRTASATCLATCMHILRNGSPSEVLFFLSPTASLNGLRTYGAYLADTWRVELAPDAVARRQIRSVPIVPARADRSAGRSVQPDADDVPGRGQPADVEPACAARRLHLRPERQRQDRPEGQRGACTGGIRAPARSTSR